MAEGVYLLCAVHEHRLRGASVARVSAQPNAAAVLERSLFVGLALNNVLLLVDLVVVPDVDLSLWRIAAGLGALMILLVGLVGEPQ